MGQVWSKAQNAGNDGQWGTPDDVLAPINQQPVDVSIDMVPNDGGSIQDRVRGFLSFHPGTCNFVFADGSTHVINESIGTELYRAISTRAGGETGSLGDL